MLYDHGMNSRQSWERILLTDDELLVMMCKIAFDFLLKKKIGEFYTEEVIAKTSKPIKIFTSAIRFATMHSNSSSSTSLIFISFKQSLKAANGIWCDPISNELNGNKIQTKTWAYTFLNNVRRAIPRSFSNIRKIPHWIKKSSFWVRARSNWATFPSFTASTTWNPWNNIKRRGAYFLKLIQLVFVKQRFTWHVS